MYKTNTFEIHHFDFYRLSEAGIVADELAEVAGDPQVVVVVEWGNVVQHALPDDRLTVSLQLLPDGVRQVTAKAPLELRYLIEAMK